MCSFGATHLALKLLFQVPALPMGQLSYAGLGEVRNFLARGLMKTWFQAIHWNLWPLALTGKPAAAGYVAHPCPWVEQVTVPHASGLFESSSPAFFWLLDQLQQGSSQAAHLTRHLQIWPF